MHMDYAGEYAKAQVTSVDRTRLLLLVFEGGLSFLQRARAGLAAGDLAAFGQNLGRAQAIIAELLGTLDYEAGGTIARDLARLYDFMLVHLTEANARQSVRHVDEVLAAGGCRPTGRRAPARSPSTGARSYRRRRPATASPQAEEGGHAGNLGARPVIGRIVLRVMLPGVGRAPVRGPSTRFVLDASLTELAFRRSPLAC